MSTIATTGPTAQQSDARFNADRETVRGLTHYLERYESDRYVGIAQVMTNVHTGESWSTGVIGRFMDRNEAARFMTDNAAMFNRPDTETHVWTYGLVLVESVERRTVTVL